MSLLIYAGLAVGLTLAAYRSRGTFYTLLLQVLPFAFLFCFLWMSRDRYEVLQVRKVGYQFDKATTDYRSPARSIYLGGDRKKDDLYDAALPQQAVRITPALHETSVAVDVLEQGVLLFRNQDPANVIVLRDGDRVQSGNQEIAFHSKGSFARSFTSGTKEWIWPRAQKKIAKVKDAFVTGFSNEYFPISQIGKSLGVDLQSKSGLILQKSSVSLSRRPFQLNRILLIGGGDWIKVNGKSVPSNFEFHDGDSLRLYVLQQEGESPHLRQTMAYVLRNDQALTFFHPLPQTLGIQEDLLRTENGSRKPLLVSTGSLPYSVFPAAHYPKESQRFQGLFGFIQIEDDPQHKSFGEQVKRQLLKFFSLDRKKFEVVTDFGIYRPASGEQFAIGKSDRMLFKLDQVRFPWGALQLLLVLFLLKAIFQPPFTSPVNHRAGQLLMISVVDFFILTRFLFGFRAATLYPFSYETVPGAILSVLLLPYLLFAGTLLLQNNPDRSKQINFGVYTLLMILVSALLLRSRFWFIASIGFLASALVFVRHSGAVISARFTQWQQGLQRFSPGQFALFFFGVVLLLQLSGAGEAVWFAGFRIPLPVLYHPFLLLFSCYYLYQLEQHLHLREGYQSPSEVYRILLKFGAVLAGFFGVSLLLSDLGFFLIYCLPLLFLLFGVSILYLKEYELRWKLAGAAMALPLAAFLLLFTAYSTIVSILPQSYLGSSYIQRILLSVNPAVLEESGLVVTEKQLGHQRLFLAYSHSGWSGAGYMSRPINSGLSGTVLNDNVPAAFLLNDFGIAGFAAVLLILLLAIWLWFQAALASRRRFKNLLSLAALITFVYADVYMILTNCGIFLFTGKNVFLWGLNSTSDLFHSAIILLLVLLPSLSPVMKTAPAAEITQEILLPLEGVPAHG